MKKVTPKKFSNQAAQGDLLARRLNTLPEGCTPMPVENGQYVVAHSETGHPHTVAAAAGVQLYNSSNPTIMFMKVGDKAVALLVHNKDYDVHAPVMFDPGVYELRRQQEFTPRGWEAVRD